MSRVQTIENRLVEVNRLANSLLVKKSSAPYQSRQTAAAFLFLLACVLFAIAYTVAAQQQQFRWVLGVLGVGVALVAVRMLDIRGTTGKEDLFRFDVGEDRIERNGQELAKPSEVDHVLVRRIRRDDDEDPEDSDYALVIALLNTKRFTVAESDGVPGARSQILQAAQELARYLGVPVKEGERLPSEYWMDR